MTFDHEAELREEARQSELSKHFVDLVADSILHQFGMVNQWGRGRTGESILQNVQTKLDEMTGWVEES